MKLSIITINFNNAAGLKKTMESVLAQTSTDFEYIVIDGGSTDGSVEVIQSYTQAPAGIEIRNSVSPITFWISEPDAGIYSAMNKGLKKAEGEFIHFLNSGDWLTDEKVVENMFGYLNSQTDILVGDVVFARPDGKIQYSNSKKDISLLTFYGSTIHHTSAYIRKSLFERYGLYDESLKIVADWKWYLIASGLNDARIHFADVYVSCFDTTGISSINEQLKKTERRQVLEAVVPEPILADYDRFYFHMLQIERMKKSKWLYGLFWFAERCLFKIEKWRLKYFGWDRSNSL